MNNATFLIGIGWVLKKLFIPVNGSVNLKPQRQLHCAIQQLRSSVIQVNF